MSSEKEEWKNQNLSPEERVELWLGKEGTPLEFETAVAFDKASFEVTQGEHQTDPSDDGGAPLEIDVLAAQRVAEDDLEIGHDVIVECKYAAHPWVAFLPLTTSRRQEPAWQRPLEDAVLEVARWRARTLPVSKQVPPVWPPSPRAFGLKPLHGKAEKDNAYAALEGVVRRARLRAADPRPKRVHITQVPMVVLGGDLCVARWDDVAKKLSIASAPACTIDFRGDRHLPSVEVQVVTAKALPSWLARFAVHLRERANALLEYAPQVQECLEAGDFEPLGLNLDVPEESRLSEELSSMMELRGLVLV